MKVLWFAHSPSLYRAQNKGYNGCGWISSLEENILKIPSIELAICLIHPQQTFKEKIGSVLYYPISLYNTKLKKILHNLFYSHFDNVEVKEYLRVINDFRPDVIHVFGSEKAFGLITEHTNIPVIIHIQGILNPCLNAWFPPGTGKLDYIKYGGLLEGLSRLKGLRLFEYNSKREEKILTIGKYFMGRTDWDKAVVQCYAPNSVYHYCSEILRHQFYEALPWEQKTRKNIVLVSIISKAEYKGFDLILKTAAILKKYQINFEWHVFGIKEYSFWEKKLKIKSTNVNVILKGIADTEELIKALQEGDLYVHPSYIDNSPNSLCEAQLLGIPVISTNVGGISSIIINKVTGLTIPANDPFILAEIIINSRKNIESLAQIGMAGRQAALTRHNAGEITNRTLEIYDRAVSGSINGRDYYSDLKIDLK